MSESSTQNFFLQCQDIFFFLQNVQTESGATEPPVQWGVGVLSRGWNGRDVTLADHLHQEPRLAMRGAVPLLLALTDKLTFTVQCKLYVRARKNLFYMTVVSSIFTPCYMLHLFRRFGRRYCLHLQGDCWFRLIPKWFSRRMCGCYIRMLGGICVIKGGRRETRGGQ
jgi:hypothetical protein